ncbi:MAG: hypothetical protein ACLFP4_15105 [Spirochaetales bacterium]
MATAVVNRLADLPAQMRRSIAFDNGQENRHHTTMRDALNLVTYFCDPYSSWQKGSVDPRGATVEYSLKTRPRKRFGFLSPLEYASRVALTP